MQRCLLTSVAEQATYNLTSSKNSKGRFYHDLALLFLVYKPEDHWSCIAHLNAEDMLKSGVIEEKKFKNTESEWSGQRSMNDLDLW